jgi:hypothetical protein
MKTIKTFGVALVAMLTLGVVSTSVAAAYEWQLNGKAITEATAVSWTSTITFENALEEYKYRCTMAYKGTVGPGAKSEITSITSTGGAKVISCESLQKSVDCESAVEIEAVGLPWASEVGKSDGEVRNTLTNHEKEWKIKCKGSVPTNWCAVSPSTGVHTDSVGVETIYDSNSPGTACFENGGTSLYTRGSGVPKPASGTLSISPVEPEWRLAGAALSEPLATEWKGTLKLTDRNFKSYTVSAECEDTASGPVGLGGQGEVTHWTASNCSTTVEAEQLCNTKTVEGKVTFEAVNLPWHTELVNVEGAPRDVISSGGGGAPGFKWSCKVAATKVSDECTATTLGAAMTSITGGVAAKFNEDEKLNCKEGGSGEGTLEGAQTIAGSGGTLETTK